MSEEKETLMELIELTTFGKPAPLPLTLIYHPESGSESINKVMNGRKDRIKEFYYRLLFGHEEVPLDRAVTDVFEGRCAQVSGQAIDDLVHLLGNNGGALADLPWTAVYSQMDFTILVGWKAIIKTTLPKALDSNHLKLAPLSDSFPLLPGAKPLKLDDVETRAQIKPFSTRPLGRWWRSVAPSQGMGGQLLRLLHKLPSFVGGCSSFFNESTLLKQLSADNATFHYSRFLSSHSLHDAWPHHYYNI